MSEIKLIHADCLNIMKTIPDKSVDLVLTDPPYNASNNKLGFRNKNYRTINEKWDKKFKPKRYLDEIFRILKDQGSVLIFCSYHLLGIYLTYPKKIQQILHWEHITPFPAITKIYIPTIEYILWWTTKNYIFNKKMAGKNIIRYYKAHYEGKTHHPSPKPVGLTEYLIKIHSKPTDTICDPFMGSGTTGVACHNLNRNFIGIEKDAEYFKIAKKRIADAQKQQRLDFSETVKPGYRQIRIPLCTDRPA